MTTEKMIIAGRKAKINNELFELTVCNNMGYEHIVGSKDKADAWYNKIDRGISIKRMSGKSTCVQSTTGKKLLELFDDVDEKLFDFIYALCHKTINLNEHKAKEHSLNKFYNNCESILNRVLAGHESEIRAHIIEMYDGKDDNLLARFYISKMIQDFLDDGEIVISPGGTTIWFILEGDKILHLQRKGSGPTENARSGLYFHIHKHPRMFKEWSINRKYF
jgi:hypothetical protein